MVELPSYVLNGLKILVVDDNKNMRLIVLQVLHSLGIREIREADDGADAFKVMRTFDADLIICDWVMEPLDGIDFTRMVRSAKDSPNPFVPIIMLTGHTEFYRVMEARDAGVNEFIAKPISAKSLYTRMVSVIERPRPFVKINTYYGPCRRRQKTANFNGQDRRQVEPEHSDLSQAEVESLLGA